MKRPNASFPVSSLKLLSAVLLTVFGVSCSSSKKNRNESAGRAAQPSQDFLYDGDYGIGVPFSTNDSGYRPPQALQASSQSQTRYQAAKPRALAYRDSPELSPAPAQAGVARGARARAASTRAHTVQSGDSLWRISQKYGVSVPALMAANSLSSDVIRAGSVLAIP